MIGELIHEYMLITKIVLIASAIFGAMPAAFCFPGLLAATIIWDIDITRVVTKKHYGIALISMAASVTLLMMLELDVCTNPVGVLLLANASYVCVPLALAGFFIFMDIRLPDGSTAWRGLRSLWQDSNIFVDTERGYN